MREPSEFTKTTIEMLAKRAGQMCSNPDCNRSTSGGHTERDKAVIVGEAAHIHGQKPGKNKRYDPFMTDEQRSDISNGIWLCSVCHKRIDSDEIKYPAKLLFKWKDNHESTVLDKDKKHNSEKVSIPILTLRDATSESMGYQGGPNGHYHYFTIVNLSKTETAFDCRCWIKGFGYWWEPSIDAFTLEPESKIELEYPIPTYPPDSAPEIPGLQFVMQYKNLAGETLRSIRLLKQSKVRSGILNKLGTGEYIPPQIIDLPPYSIKFLHITPSFGDNIKAEFEVKDGLTTKIITLGISGTFWATWGLLHQDQIEAVFKDLGIKKIEKLCKEGQLDDYIFVADNFPPYYQNGYGGYKQLYDSI